MRQPAPTNPWKNLLMIGAGIIFATGALFFGLQQDAAQTDAHTRGIIALGEQIQLANENAKAIRNDLAKASRLLQPYCATQADAPTQLVFAALNLSTTLRPTISSGGNDPGALATPLPSPSPASQTNNAGSSAAAAVAHAAQNVAKAVTQTPPPLPDAVVNRSLTATYSGDFTSLVTALNAFALKPVALGITIVKINRGSLALTATPPPTGAQPNPSASSSPAPGNQLTISAIFNRPILTPDACTRIEQYARPDTAQAI